MKTLTSLEQVKEAIASERLSVLLFTTTWCPDCHALKPFMPAVEKQFDDMDFYEVDRDQLMDLAQALGVMGIPSFVTFKKSEVVSSFISTLRKTQTEVSDYLTKTREQGKNHA